MGILEVKGINKRFGGLQALGDVNLSVTENTTHAIICLLYTSDAADE